MKWSSRWIYSGRNLRFDQSVWTLSSVLKFVFFISNLLIINVTFNQPTVCFLPVQMMALFCFLYMVYCRVQLSGDKHSAPSSLSFFPSCYEQSMEHLSWLGLFKDLSERTQKASPFYHKRALRKTPEECEHVREKYLQMRFEPTHWAQTIVLYVCRNRWRVNVVLSVFSKQFSGGIGRSEAVPEDPDLR